MQDNKKTAEARDPAEELIKKGRNECRKTSPQRELLTRSIDVLLKYGQLSLTKHLIRRCGATFPSRGRLSKRLPLEGKPKTKETNEVLMGDKTHNNKLILFNIHYSMFTEML